MLTKLLSKFRRRPQAATAVTLPKLDAANPHAVNSFNCPYFWAIGPDKRASCEAAVEALSQQLPVGVHVSDNLVTWGRNNSMLDDGPFVAAWRANIERPSDEAIIWRRYILATSAYHCINLGGDFVECGAFTGVGMKTVMDYLGGTAFPRAFWGYDLFEHEEGMPNAPMEGLGAGLYERVEGKFAGYPQVQLIRGLIPESFSIGCPTHIAYLHIDLNQAPAELAVLDHLFDRVVPGGMVILDDYEWSGYRGQKLAEDSWFDQRDYRVMPLPTGQGLVIKR